MVDMLANAMAGVTTVFEFITSNAVLAAIAIGFPLARASTRVLKRIIKL